MGELTNDVVSDLLSEYVKTLNRESNGLQIPLHSNGTKYKIENLEADQKEALAVVLNAVKRYCEGKDVSPDKILRLTVSGVAGSRKSTWINTLVSTLRKFFVEDATVSVFAPTGSAAYNAEGKTIHRGFRVPVRSYKSLDIAADKQKYLLGQFAKTLIIIIAYDGCY